MTITVRVKTVKSPNGYWCRACGVYQSARDAKEVVKAKAHTQAHIDAGEQPRDGRPWTHQAPKLPRALALAA